MSSPLALLQHVRFRSQLTANISMLSTECWNIEPTKPNYNFFSHQWFSHFGPLLSGSRRWVGASARHRRRNIRTRAAPHSHQLYEILLSFYNASHFSFQSFRESQRFHPALSHQYNLTGFGWFVADCSMPVLTWLQFSSIKKSCSTPYRLMSRGFCVPIAFEKKESLPLLTRHSY